MGKIEEKKLRERQRLIQLQNIKDWTGMTLGIMMSEINRKKRKKIVSQLQIADAT